MGDAGLAASWANEVALLTQIAVRVVVVHGGGPALSRTLARLGIESTFVDGHRITTRESAEVAEMVLSGRINKEVVSLLARAGARAIGLSGTDARILTTRPLRPAGRDLGFVGEVESVETELLQLLLENGYTPVLSSTAEDGEGQPWNINADLVAGTVAAALNAARLVFLSDVAGLLDNGAAVPAISSGAARRLLEGSEITGGMRPKLQGALSALEGGVPEVLLADGRVTGALTRALGSHDDSGTRLVPGSGALPREIAGSSRRALSERTLADSTSTGLSESFDSPPWAGTLAERGGACVMGTYARYPIEIASGSGCRVRDSAGRSYLDFVSGIAVNGLGHGHPAVVRALRAASEGMLHTSNLYWTEPMVHLAERLTAASGMERAFYCNSGAEAIETALKVARKARPGRSRIVVFERSFHGRTLGALSATIQPSYQDPFRPLLPGIVSIPFGDFEASSGSIDEQTAAVLVEPVQGEGGVRPAPPSFLAHLRKLCDRTGALLFLDEVQTGIGRTGSFFAYQREPVLPDGVACAKGLAAGLPMGALLARGEAASALGKSEHGSTFGGGPFVSVVALAVIDTVLAPGFLGEVRSKGEHLGARLRALAGEYPALVTQVRGCGLMWGLVLGGEYAADLVGELHAAGLLTVPAGKDVLRLLPPLTVSLAEIDEGAALLGSVLRSFTARHASEIGQSPS